MKKTQLIELLCLIRRTIVPFLSIVLFVTMSITLYAGLTWTGQSLQNRIDEAFNQANTCDFGVVSKLGLTDSDLDELSQLSEVSDVEPVYISYQTIRNEGEGNSSENLYCSLYSMTERINKLDLVEGSLPTEPDEIALLCNCTKFCNYKVGDTITFEADGDDPSANGGMKYLKNRTFTITGLVSSTNYLCNSLTSLGTDTDGKQITCVFYASKSAFSSDAFGGSYPGAYVTGSNLRGLSSFGEAYKAVADKIYDVLEETGDVLAQSRYASLLKTADEKIGEGQSQLDEAKSKIADADAQVSDGEQQLASKTAELAAAKDELASKIAELRAKKSDAETQFASVESALEQGRAKLSQTEQEYAEGKSTLDYYRNMSSSLKTLSSELQASFESMKSEAQTHLSDPDFATWLTNKCINLNAETDAKVAAFKEAYPTRPDELEALLDGLEVSTNDPRTDSEALKKDQKAAENAVGLGVAADKIQTDVVQPGEEKLAEAETAISQMSEQINAAQAELDSNRAQYEEGIASANSMISEGQSEISSGERQLAEGESQLADAKAQLSEKKSQYADGESTLSQAKADVDSLKFSRWIVTDRSDSYVDQLADTTTRTLSGLRLTMALLFMVVGLLVCYSVMSRLVHEHLAQLGTKKALGFTLFEIAKQFLGYAILACVLGTLLGTFVGAPVVQMVLIPSVDQYVFDSPGAIFQFADIVVPSLAQVILICLSAWLACRSILEKNAVELLGGQRPLRAKRRFYEGWSCWERMGLLTQTMVNNCFNDKRRVFGTLVGVAGCTALIVCAVTLQVGIRATTDEQENVVERFDQVVYVTSDKQGSASTGAVGTSVTTDEVIAARAYPSVKALYKSKSLDMTDGSDAYVTFMVPESMEALTDVMTLQMVQGDGSLSEDGVYISSALANYYHYGVGDELIFDGLDGTDRIAVVTGVFNYYGGTHVVIMGKDAYDNCFGRSPRYTARLVDSGSEAAEFSEMVKSAIDYDRIVDSREITHEISETVNRLALTVVAIYIGISALVALFVLLNLNIMHIAEKKRELIVMMVNGYEVKDAKRYVSRDTVIMDVLGMVIGCLLGTGMGILAVHSLQNDRLAFMAVVSPLAWVIGVVVCALFSSIVMCIALRRVDKFKLTSVND